MSKSGGGSESNKRVAVEEGGDSTDGPGKLKKSKTTAIDYDADAYKNLNGRLKKNGISTDHTKALDDTSKQVLQSCIQDPNQR